MDLRIILPYRKRYLFEQSSLSCFWRRHDHSSLSLADGGQKIHDPHGCACPAPLQLQPLIGEDGRHVFKIRPAHSLHRIDLIDPGQVQKRAELLLLSLDPGMSFQDIAGLQVKLADLGRRDVHIVLAWKIVVAPDKSISVREHFQDSADRHTAVQLINVVDFPVAGVGGHLFHCVFLFLFLFFIFLQHKFNDLCLLRCRNTFDPSRFRQISQGSHRQRLILFSHHFPKQFLSSILSTI